MTSHHHPYPHHSHDESGAHGRRESNVTMNGAFVAGLWGKTAALLAAGAAGWFVVGQNLR